MSRQVLRAATMVLCKGLEPTDLLLTLFAQKIIDFDDKQRVESEKNDRDKVNTLLMILRRVPKPVDAYCYCMEHFERVNPSLYQQLKKFENKEIEEATRRIKGM